MLHHEESPEKSQYNIEPLAISRQPPILSYPSPFSSKDFQNPPPPPISINFEKVNLTPLYEMGGSNYVLCGAASFETRNTYIFK